MHNPSRTRHTVNPDGNILTDTKTPKHRAQLVMKPILAAGEPLDSSFQSMPIRIKQPSPQTRASPVAHDQHGSGGMVAL